MKFDQLLYVLLALVLSGGGCRKGPAEAEMSLHQAAAAGDVKRVRELLSDGADVTARDGSGQTPLHRACGGSGGVAMIGLLVDRGAEIDANDATGATPLHLAAANDLALVESLLNRGANVHARDKNGRTPLHAAVREERWERVVAKAGKKSVAQLLLAGGADIDAPDADSATPLHHAAFLGHGRAVKQLLTAGANVNAKNHRGETPLHRAILSGSGEIVERLIAQGADVNAADREGWTPLHVAAFHGYTEAYDLFVVRGANASIKTNEGKGAADLAKDAADRQAIMFPSAEKGGPYAMIVTDPGEIATFVRAYDTDFDRVWVPAAGDLEWTGSVLRTALDAPAGLPAPEGFELEYVRAHLHQYNRQYGGFIKNGRKYLLSNMYLSDSVIEEDSSFLTESSPGEEGAPPVNGFTMICDGGAIAVRALFDAETRTLVHIECNGM